MKNKKLDFKNVSFKDNELIDKLSRSHHFKSYLKNHKEINADFTSFSEKKQPHFTYCVCFSEDKLLSLIITEDISRDPPDYMIPYVEEEKKTLWMDLIFLVKEEVESEHATELLSAFVLFCPKEVGALITDPEVKEESTISLYEMAGFTRVGTFLKGQGFFKGTSHYIMKFKI